MTRISALLFSLMLAVVAVGCGGDSEGTDTTAETNGEATGTNEDAEVITQKGSDTMVLLAQKWAEVYGASNPDVEIQVSGGGSGTGISALINGTTQIANASRPMKEEEKVKMKEKYGTDPYEVAVAKDGITVYVHPDNALESLTLEQLRGIFEGNISNWNEVGGPDAPIVRYGRENSSGTYDYFKEVVLDKGDFSKETAALPGTAAVVNAVSKDPNGIGYGGAAYSSGIKIVKLSADGGEALEPSLENVSSGKYPLARDLYFYMAEPPFGKMKEFIDWILSDDGQQYTREMEYFPVKAAAGAATEEVAAEEEAATEGA